MLKHSVVVVQAQQERSQRPLAALVPAESRHYAVGAAHVLDLEHRALARLIRCACRLGDNTIQPRTLEALQPVDCELRVAGHRRQMEWAADLLEELLELAPALRLRDGQ